VGALADWRLPLVFGVCSVISLKTLGLCQQYTNVKAKYVWKITVNAFEKCEEHLRGLALNPVSSVLPAAFKLC
jgi:hypothetical protein